MIEFLWGFQIFQNFDQIIDLEVVVLAMKKLKLKKGNVIFKTGD